MDSLEAQCGRAVGNAAKTEFGRDRCVRHDSVQKVPQESTHELNSTVTVNLDLLL